MGQRTHAGNRSHLRQWEGAGPCAWTVGRSIKHVPVLLWLLMIAPAAGTLGTGPAAADDWSHAITPSLGVSKTHTGFAPAPAQPDAQAHATLQADDTALQIAGVAQRRGWSVLGEFNTLSASDGYTLGTGGLNTGGVLQGTVMSLGAGYTVFDDSTSSVQVIGALRRWDLGSLTDTATRQSSGSLTFIDPLLGLRVETPVGGGVLFQGQANIGGEGRGPEQQVDAMAQITVPLRDTMSVSAGYRYLDLGFGEDAAVSDTTVQGPFVSFSFNF